MHDTYTDQGQSSKIFSRLQITDLDALPQEDAQIFEPGILVKGCAHQIVAPYESGKTFLAWKCAEEFLKKGLKICYLDYENRKSSTKERVDILGIDATDKGNLLYLNNPNLDLSKDSKEQWVNFLDYHCPLHPHR